VRNPTRFAEHIDNCPLLCTTRRANDACPSPKGRMASGDFVLGYRCRVRSGLPSRRRLGASAPASSTEARDRYCDPHRPTLYLHCKVKVQGCGVGMDRLHCMLVAKDQLCAYTYLPHPIGCERLVCVRLCVAAGNPPYQKAPVAIATCAMSSTRRSHSCCVLGSPLLAAQCKPVATNRCSTVSAGQPWKSSTMVPSVRDPGCNAIFLLRQQRV